jgi:hypothetical protein
MSEINETRIGVVQRMGERIARRELFRRAGRWSLGAAFASLVIGVDPANAINCARVTGDCTGLTVCFGHTCKYWTSGYLCARRVGQCCSGGQCWTNNNGVTCCDWYDAHGNPCSCCAAT